MRSIVARFLHHLARHQGDARVEIAARRSRRG
jgi:hypothetical protein